MWPGIPVFLGFWCRNVGYPVIFSCRAFCEVARGGDVIIAYMVHGRTIVARKVHESKCGVRGTVGAGERGHERPWCRNSTVCGQNRALGAWWEVLVLIFQTGGRVRDECVAVSLFASVRAWSRVERCDVGRSRCGVAVLAVRAQVRAFGPTSKMFWSRGEGTVVVAWHVMEGCRLCGAVADLGRAVVVSAGVEAWGSPKPSPHRRWSSPRPAASPVDAARVRAWTRPVEAASMATGTAASAPPHSAWHRRRARGGNPAGIWGGEPFGAHPEPPPAPMRRAWARGGGGSSALPPPRTRGRAAARWGRGGEVGAGAERHPDGGDSALAFGATPMGTRGDGSSQEVCDALVCFFVV